MKAPKEVKSWINRRRSASAKRNGVVSWLWDVPPKWVKFMGSPSHRDQKARSAD